LRAFRRLAKPTTTVLALLTIVGLIVAGCATTGADPDGRGAPGMFPPPAATSQGVGVDEIYPLIFWIAVAVFVLVEGLIIFAVLRYRRRPEDVDLPVQTHGNNVLEVIWTVIPAAVVAVMFILTLGFLQKTEARPPDGQFAVTVDVTGFQWQWMFEYKDQGLSFTGLGEKGPEMVLPVNEPVLIRLHSNDVIHSFYVPKFLYKKDVIPGRVNEFPVTLTEPDQTYVGQCAEYCGLSHNQMYMSVRSVTGAEFDAWVQSEQEKAKNKPSPGPSGSGAPVAGASIELSASSATKFDQATAEAPANQPLTIVFHNKDAAAPHNVSIKAATPQGDFVGDPLAKPGETAQYSAPPLPPGDYTFYCVVHPNMTGKLTVH
jgi:cytochrome c oxidase subunit II